MTFTLVGALALFCVPSLDCSRVNLTLFLSMAEVGLVLLLFTDACRTDLHILKSIRSIPARLLSVGLLLTIFLGALGAKLVFPAISIWEAGILGAILAPTDAGLGQPIVNDQRVPAEVRQALNVEAGLNDGLCVPFMLFFMVLAGGVGGNPTESSLLTFMFDQLLLGCLIGLFVGLLGGFAFGAATKRGWVAEGWQQLGLMSLPILCLLLAEHFESSMFIAAFVAGLVVQLGYKEAGKHSVEFSEESGQLLNLSVFLLFGVFCAKQWRFFEFAHLIYALCSLTVIRILPVFVSLFGTGLSWKTKLFIGWFGPRGLASIVLALVYLEGQLGSQGQTIQIAAMMTVLLSIFLHGLSTYPGISLYSRSLE